MAPTEDSRSSDFSNLYVHDPQNTARNTYGTAAGFPPTFEGGFAVVRVHLSPGLDAILQINCTIGNPPPGHPEGVRLAVQNALNFNEEVSGFTVFIRQS